jgi:antibiotic biosynthesis monooxygenase (ABM) superfamily enzyme
MPESNLLDTPVRGFEEVVTLIIKHRVKAGFEAPYEAWLRNIVRVAGQWDGHLGVDVVRGKHAGLDTYTCVLRFCSTEAMQRWLDSEQRQALISEATPMLADGDQTEVNPVNEFWFAPAAEAGSPPPRWKQAVVTLLVILPHTLLVPLLWGPLLKLNAWLSNYRRDLPDHPDHRVVGGVPVHANGNAFVRALAILIHPDQGNAMNADLILFNGQFHTVDREKPLASAVAISDGRFVAVGSDAEAMALRGSATQVIDLKGRCVIPGLNDSHLHLIRGGLNYNLELRWEGVPSLADACACSRTRPIARRRRNGCGWSVAGTNSSSPKNACRPSKNSTRPRPIPRCSSCTCTTAPCSTAPRCAWPVTPATPRTRRAARSSAMPTASRPACWWRDPTR